MFTNPHTPHTPHTPRTPRRFKQGVSTLLLTSPLPLIPNARCFMPGNPSTALAPPCRSWGPVSSPPPHLPISPSPHLPLNLFTRQGLR
ncbi:hypothetical protein [Fischerella sp. FACHB-380]|uniref:hypothetical protein n=1 Tax=Fischerella sp. FACHB-380 TaxID=2692799 RepID=UPI000312314D|nr:hypothetical protein [Fischerella sp. FACHB-380]MBD2431266.1 hypothetical protein [Fischerella sp. FACHB-380]